MRHVAANLLWVLAAIGLVGLLAILEAKRAVEAPGPLEEPALVKIPRGTLLPGATERLVEAGALPEDAIWGAVSGAWLFRVAARYTDRDEPKAAEYRIPPRASIDEILEILDSGLGVQHRITVPEGLTSWEVVQLLNDSNILAGEIESIPEEGSLAPDTYFVNRGTERTRLIARMQAAQHAILAEAWANRSENLPIDSAEEALILASIIEKETAVAEERNLVASVFVNRLRKGWRLETDPAVIYGITGGKGALGRGLRQSELEAETPYNTYKIDGLPPTPIANPGAAAIEAALNPAETEYLFFVADGSGGHAFAETAAEHAVNVRKWRRLERQNQEP